MVFIPLWITNLLFFVTCAVAGYQHSRLRRDNPVTNIQFMMIVFSLFMIVLDVLYTRNYANAWVSLAFFLVAAGSLFVIARRHRMLPPRKSFE